MADKYEPSYETYLWYFAIQSGDNKVDCSNLIFSYSVSFNNS